MRTLISIAALTVLSISSFGQNRFGTPVGIGGVGNAVMPPGMAAAFPGAVRWNPIPARPGGGGQRPVGPGQRTPRYTGTGAIIVPYAYPVYVNGYDAPPADPEATAQPSVTTFDAQQTPPVIVRQYADPPMGQDMGQDTDPNNPEPVSTYQPRQPDGQQTDRYLIALTDHTIYSVIAYWVDGDTLHYFTAGNVHNQVSMSLVDRALTFRLNKEMGATVNFPGGQNQ